MPVSNISVVGVRSSTVGAGRWIGQRSLTSMSAPWSIGSPSRVKMRPSVTAPTGAGIGPPGAEIPLPRAGAAGERPAGVEDLRTAREAVGGVHGDRAHAVVAEVLLHLAHEVRAGAGRDALGLFGVVFALDDDRRVDLGQLVREDGFDDDALDLLDPADVPSLGLSSHISP